MTTKNLNHRVLWLLIPLLTLFNLSAWGTDETITLVPTSSPSGLTWTTNPGGTEGVFEFTSTDNAITVSGTHAKVTASYLNIYGSNSGTMTFSSSSKIKSIVISATTNATNNRTRTITLTSGGGSLSGNSVSNNVASVTANSNATPEDVTWTNSSGSTSVSFTIGTGQTYFWSIQVSYESSGGCTAPTIGTQPTAATYTVGDSPTALSVSATGTSLTYQWYSNTTSSTTGASSISGANNSTYSPSTASAGTTYYYCIVSSGSCTTTSSIVGVTVNNPTYTVTWSNNGATFTTTQVYSGEKPTLPANPTNCDATSNTFYGWSTAEWSGAIDDISAKTIYTDASAMPAVTGNGTVYYAVFAKAAKSDNYQLLTDDNNFISGEDYLIEEYYSSTDHVLKAANYNNKAYYTINHTYITQYVWKR